MVLVSFKNTTGEEVRHVELHCTVFNGKRKVRAADAIIRGPIRRNETRDYTTLIRIGDEEVDYANCGGVAVLND